MSDKQFPSGPWVGFYTRRRQNKKHRMDLGLTFAKGTIKGEGNDDVGQFLIRGKYDPKTMECHWTKAYVAKHDVFYQGFREGKGIYGKWEIGTKSHGGFHIWPVGSGGGDGDAETKTEETPLTHAVAKPVAIGSPTRGSSYADDHLRLRHLGEQLVQENRILDAADIIGQESKSQFQYRVFYVLLARMMQCCTREQSNQVSVLMAEYAVGLPGFLDWTMRWKELNMYMRRHDVAGVKKCLMRLEGEVWRTVASKSGSA
jgi:hypothetical protein